METLRGLPENASWQEIEDRTRFLAAIDKAFRSDEVVPHEEVRNLPGQWNSA